MRINRPLTSALALEIFDIRGDEGKLKIVRGMENLSPALNRELR